jgi:phosphate transport system permease protein
MLVGVKKLAVDLPIDGTFPFVHPEREFMHLAYLIYDVGFQSPNSQAAQPMVFTITFLLVTIIALLNLAAIWLRSRLKRRFIAQQF